MNPDLTRVPEGPLGTAAWFDPEEFREESPAAIAMWLITAPGYCSAWSQYTLGIVSLADIEGLPPAKRDNPQQTHELLVATLNPDLGPHTVASILRDRQAPILEPLNICERFTVASDEAAAHLGWLHVWAVLNGQLCPETHGVEFVVRPLWRHSIAQVVDHQAGRHG